ncbi:MAG: EAL domain-containing protein [Nitrospinae bacterium]|nr:EAL domain-containing protein [Nitrospinota bacterium]
MNALVPQSVLLSSAMPKALRDGEFAVYYQPKVDSGTGSIAGMEALARWVHPVMGMVPPDRFIPAAEESGFIVELGEWVLRAACAQNRAWRDAGLPRLTVAVNCSIKQLTRGDFPDLLARILKETGLPPDGLELEITESVLFEDPLSIVPELTRLRDLGIRLAIDDFGTGYSSLAYLGHLPVHVLKIDKIFVKNIVHGANFPILRAIVDLAKKLGLTIVLEGVETAEHAAAVAPLGADQLQGFYYGRPVSAENSSRVLARGLSLTEKADANNTLRSKTHSRKNI